MNWGISLIIAFIITSVVTPLLIPFLRKLKFGQTILEDGPIWHSKKQGTPTMGGLAFILAIAAATLLVSRDKYALYVVVSGLLFGAVGFIDDYIKVVKKRNKGFSAAAKFLCQTLCAVILAIFAFLEGLTEIRIPFVSGVFNIGVLIIPFTAFVFLATVNSVNLTDGIDGLASSVSCVCALFFMAAAVKLGNGAVSVVLGATIGGLLGFLIYNFFPAKVFMGDTGSLFLGGILSGAAVVLGMEFFLIIAGFVFLSETMSDIIQVSYYKKTKKRIFKMAPLHHHFEMCGWKETKIVGIFTLVTAILCAVCYLGLIVKG
ncbi:MAG: phospho-N-acetylmuramoyl-pentapeptide-transferase [Clostridia bacterium]